MASPTFRSSKTRRLAGDRARRALWDQGIRTQRMTPMTQSELRLGTDAAARQNPELSAARRATANGALRKRLTTLKATRSTGRFTPPKLKPVRRIGKRPAIRSGAVVPPVGGLIRGAISIGRGLFRGSPVTGPTKGARISQAAAGPLAGVRRRSGGSARTM